MKNFKYLYLFIFLFVGIKGYGQTQVNTSVKKVYVIFKTHLDVGFTDLSSVATDRYITEFIPKAIDVAEAAGRQEAPKRCGIWLCQMGRQG